MVKEAAEGWLAAGHDLNRDRAIRDVDGSHAGRSPAPPKPVSGKRMLKLLKDRGWVHVRTNGSHFVFHHPDSTGRIEVPVHGNRRDQEARDASATSCGKPE